MSISCTVSIKNRKFFFISHVFNVPAYGVSPSNTVTAVRGAQLTIMMALWKKSDMCIHLDITPQCDRQMDGQKWYINIAFCMQSVTTQTRFMALDAGQPGWDGTRNIHNSHPSLFTPLTTVTPIPLHLLPPTAALGFNSSSSMSSTSSFHVIIGLPLCLIPQPQKLCIFAQISFSSQIFLKTL